MDLDYVKNYLRVDSSEDDTFIQSLIKSTDQYLKGAGCELQTNPELYSQAQMLLIAHWYQNRSLNLVGVTSRPFDFSLQSMILSLKSFKTETEED